LLGFLVGLGIAGVVFATDRGMGGEGLALLVGMLGPFLAAWGLVIGLALALLLGKLTPTSDAEEEDEKRRGGDARGGGA
jgi:hypothetical protein